MSNPDLLLDIPSLTSRRLRLRPVNPDDYKMLFQWHSDVHNLHLWWADRTILSFDEFVDDLRRRLRSHIQTMFMVDMLQDGDAIPVGMTYTYNANMVDRFTYLCVYLSPEHTRKGIGPEAGYLVAKYLFSYFGFRKIYAEIFAYNAASLKSSLRNGFREEGCLKSHRWFGDRYWDLHILAITEEDFKKLVAPVLD